MSKINIAIDGPVASGKGTVSKLVAKELGYKYLDTGAMYRAVALFLSEKEITPEAFELSHLDDLKLSFNEQNHILINDVDRENDIRTPGIAQSGAIFSKIVEIRELLNKIQKDIIQEKGYVLEGRDSTTIIAPDAQLKIYLTADLAERTRRRVEDYKKKGEIKSFGEVKMATIERDEIDMNKGKYSLKKAPDAIEIDNTHMSVELQVGKIVNLAKEKE